MLIPYSDLIHNRFPPDSQTDATFYAVGVIERRTGLYYPNQLPDLVGCGQHDI